MATASLGDLVLKFTADISEVLTATQNVHRSLTKLSDDVESAFSMAKNAFLGLAATVGIGFSVSSFVGMVKSSLDAEEHLGRLAKQIGVTGSALSALIPVAATSDTSLDSVAAMSFRLSKALQAGESGAGLQARALKALGVTGQELTLAMNNPITALQTIAKAVGSLPDGVTKNAVSMMLLGRSARETAVFLDDLSKAQHLQALYTDEDIAKAKELHDQMALLGVQVDIVKTTFANAMVPVLKDVVSVLDDLVRGTGGAKDKVEEFSKSNALREWAQRAVIFIAQVIETLIWLGKVIFAVIASVDAMAARIENLPQVRIAKTLEAGWDVFIKGKDKDTVGGELVASINENAKKAESSMKEMSEAWRHVLNDDFDEISDKFKAQFAKTNAEIAEQQKQAIIATSAWGGEMKRAMSESEVAQAREAAAALAAGLAHEAQVKAILAAEAAAGKHTKAIRDLTAAQNAYDAALASLAKTKTDESAKLAEQGISQQLEALEISYARGLRDFQSYWSEKLGLQAKNQAVEIDRLRKDVAIQEDLVEKSQAAINKLYIEGPAGPSKGDPAGKAAEADWEIKITNAKAANTKASEALLKAQSALNLEIGKSVTTGRDYYDELVKANPLILTSAKNIQEQDAALKMSMATLGMTEQQTQEYIIALDESALAELRAEVAMGDHTDAMQDAIVALQALIAARRNYAVDLGKNEGLQKQIDGWKDVLNTAENAFSNILKGGKDTFTQLTDWLKNTLIKALFQLVATKWIIPMIVSLTGSESIGKSLLNSLGGGASNLLTGGNTGGGLLNNLFGGGGGPGFSGSSLWGGISSSSFGQAMGLSSFVETASGDVALQLTSLGTTIGSAIPYIGMAMAAFSLLGGLFEKEPSKVKGQLGISAGTTGFEDNAYIASKYFGFIGFLDSQTQQFSGEAAKVFDKVIAGALDAVGDRLKPEQIERLRTKLQGMTFAGMEGEYTTEDFLQKYGGIALKQVLTAAFEELDAPLAAVVDGFSGTADEIAAFANALLTFHDATKDLPEAVKKNLTAALGTTQDSVDNITKIAVAAGVIFAADKVDMAKAASDAYLAANYSQFEALTAQGNALTDLIGKTDNSAAAADKLAQATVAYGNAAVAALVAIKQIAADLKALSESTLEGIDDSIRTDDERYRNWQSQIAAYETELKTATDPARISWLQKQIDDLTTRSWGMFLERAGEDWKKSHNWDELTPEQQTASWAQFLASMKGPAEEFKKVITDTDTWVQARLEALGGEVEKTAQQHLDDAADKMTKVADSLAASATTQQNAANTQQNAANTQQNAANTPTRVVVTVDDSGSEVGNLRAAG